VQASSPWKAAADTPWTIRMRPLFRNTLRMVYRPLSATEQQPSSGQAAAITPSA
jgi:hypothetical protein